MTVVQKQALLAISTAATALAASATALAASFDEPSAPDKPVSPPEPAKPAKPAKKEPPAAAAAPPPAAPAAPVPAAAPAAAAPTNGATDIQAQCRQKAKSYAEVYGREGLKEVLTKYTTGTLADVPADKLPELLKELS